MMDRIGLAGARSAHECMVNGRDEATLRRIQQDNATATNDHVHVCLAL